MKTTICATAILSLTSAFALAAKPANDTPAPGPEVQKLDYYVGTWKGHGETKGGPFGPAGKLSSRQTCSWFAGGFQVVCRGEETGPTGTRQYLNILSYDEKTKSYTQYSISSRGESEFDLGGSLVGNMLTYRLGGGGNAPKIRYTETQLSPSRYLYRAEAAMPGGPWQPIAEGEIVRAK